LADFAGQGAAQAGGAFDRLVFQLLPHLAHEGGERQPQAAADFDRLRMAVKKRQGRAAGGQQGKQPEADFERARFVGHGVILT